VEWISLREMIVAIKESDIKFWKCFESMLTVGGALEISCSTDRSYVRAAHAIILFRSSLQMPPTEDRRGVV
jgi:hypothetical protein